jgi:ATP-dependent protease HslVU (ClpYQ) peptidase subunit
MKSWSTKVRVLKGGKVLAEFARSVADPLTLYDKFEEKLDRQ